MKQYLTPQEAAAVIGVTESTLAKWRCSGAGPRYFKAGRVCRYSEDAIRDWMRARECASTSEYDSASSTKTEAVSASA